MIIIKETDQPLVECPECLNMVTPTYEELVYNCISLGYLNCSECGEFLGFDMTKEELSRRLGHDPKKMYP